MKMELIEGSETSDIRTKMPGNYPEGNILQTISCCGDEWQIKEFLNGFVGNEGA